LIFGILAGYVYTKIKKIPFLNWVDIVSPGIAIAQAIGRWGNYINKEAYGYITDLPWAIYIDGAYRHPTFLYESLWNIGVAVLLIYFMRKKYVYKGQIITSYAIFYSIGRFWIEGLRTDSLMLGNFRVAQLISILIIVISIGIKYLLRKMNEK
ncbi:MAG: prolipoprotein diacylglyceryl transferase, partial [Eubacteriales bacterium]